MKYNQFANPWKNFSEKWDKYYTPPGRASLDDQKKYYTYVKKVCKFNNDKNIKALVLGATPEIRNILHKFKNIEVTVLDINSKMIKEMNKFVKNFKEDKIIIGDWINNNIPNEYYDVILGDLSWGNVPKNKWNIFFDSLLRVSKKDSFLIQRICIIPDNWKVQPVKKTFDNFEKMTLTKQRHMELFFHLMLDTYNKKTKVISVGKIWKNISSIWVDNNFITDVKYYKVAILLEKLYNFWGGR